MNMTKSNVSKAVASAKQTVKAPVDNSAALAALAALGPDALAALLAQIGKPTEAAPPAVKQDNRATAFVEAAKLVGKQATISDEKHVNSGDTVKVFYCSKMSPNNKKSPVLRIETSSGELGFAKPAQLAVIGDMPKADFTRLSAMQSAQSEETLYIAATCTNETDKSIVLQYSGWARKLVFWKPNAERSGTITVTGFSTPDGTNIFEVAAWQVRKMTGMDGYNALKAKQPALSAIVDAKK
jgi:hypothetical protein